MKTNKHRALSAIGAVGLLLIVVSPAWAYDRYNRDHAHRHGHRPAPVARYVAAPTYYAAPPIYGKRPTDPPVIFS